MAEKIFNMADGIITSCNVACGSGMMTVNSPSGSTLQCDTWFWDDMPASRGKNFDWITTKVFDWSMESTAAVGVAIHSVIFGTSCTRIIQWWFRHWASHSVSVPGNRLIFSGTNASRRHIVLVGQGKVWYLWSVLGCDDSVTQWEMTTSTDFNRSPWSFTSRAD